MHSQQTMPTREAFREAFIQHVDTFGVTVAQVSREADVSKSMLQALYQRKTQVPNVHDAMLVAAYFGKSVEEFVGDVTPKDEGTARIRFLLGRLSGEQRTFVEALLKTLLSQAGR